MQSVLLSVGGVLNLAFVAFHASFWRFGKLNWRVELAQTNPVNRGAIQTMNVMLMVVFVAFAAVSFVMATADVPWAMLFSFCVVIGGFFAIRGVLQYVFFAPSPIGHLLVGVCAAIAVCYFGALAV